MASGALAPRDTSDLCPTNHDQDDAAAAGRELAPTSTATNTERPGAVNEPNGALVIYH